MKFRIALLLSLVMSLLAVSAFAVPGAPKLPMLSLPSGSPPAGPPQGGLGQPCRSGGGCDTNLICTSTPLGQFCQPQLQGGLAQPCRSGRNCDAGLVCTDTPLGGFCNPQPHGALGQPCRPNRQCDQGLACTGPDAAQLCVPPPPAAPRTFPATLPGKLNTFPGKAAVNPASWPRWVAGAKQGVRTGVPQWVQKTGLVGGVINANNVRAGALVGPPLFPLIAGGMKGAGAPDQLVAGFMGPVAEAWMAWAASISVPNLPWYPTFAAFPAPFAPPTPSPTTPLKALTQVTNSLTPPVLAQIIRTRLGGDAASPEAQAAITEFCAWFYSGFSVWLPAATISGVIGTGPVPSFLPPVVPVGPVVGGTANGGKIAPTPVWP